MQEVMCCACSNGPTVADFPNIYIADHSDIEDAVAQVNVEKDIRQELVAVLQKQRIVLSTVP